MEVNADIRVERGKDGFHRCIKVKTDRTCQTRTCRGRRGGSSRMISGFLNFDGGLKAVVLDLNIWNKRGETE